MFDAVLIYLLCATVFARLVVDTVSTKKRDRQDGAVYTGLSARFPFYGVNDIAAYRQAFSANEADGFEVEPEGFTPLPDELLRGSSDVADAQVPVSPGKWPYCYWTATLSTWACVPPHYFGLRKKQAKDIEHYPREEYRPPVALFDHVKDQEECKYPYQDRRWTAITFCFDSPQEIEGFRNLKDDVVLVNWLYATTGEQIVPMIELDARQQIVDRESSIALPRKDYYSYAALYDAVLKDGMDDLLRRRRTNFIPGVDHLPEDLNGKKPHLNRHYVAQRRLPIPETFYEMDCKKSKSGVTCRNIHLSERAPERSGYIPEPSVEFRPLNTKKLVTMPDRKHECGPDREKCYARQISERADGEPGGHSARDLNLDVIAIDEGAQSTTHSGKVSKREKKRVNTAENPSTDEYVGILPAPPKTRYQKRMPYDSEELPTPHPVVPIHKHAQLDRNLPQVINEIGHLGLPQNYDLEEGAKHPHQAYSESSSTIFPSLNISLVQSAVVRDGIAHPWSEGTTNKMKNWKRDPPLIVNTPAAFDYASSLEERVSELQEHLQWEQLERTAENGVLRSSDSRKKNDLLLPQFMAGESFVSPLFLSPQLKKPPPSRKIRHPAP